MHTAPAPTYATIQTTITPLLSSPASTTTRPRAVQSPPSEVRCGCPPQPDNACPPSVSLPPTVYHGSDHVFERFRSDYTESRHPGGIPGFHFAEDVRDAEHYAHQAAPGRQPVIHEATLTVQKPYFASNLRRERLEAGHASQALFAQALVAQGYDAIRYPLTRTKEATTYAWVVFEPDQVTITGTQQLHTPPIASARDATTLF